MYANDYIAGHLSAVNNGKTYSQTSNDARALRTKATTAAQTNSPDAPTLDARATALEAKVETLFRGETLRGLPLTSYGFSIFGDKAMLAAGLLRGRLRPAAGERRRVHPRLPHLERDGLRSRRAVRDGRADDARPGGHRLTVDQTTPDGGPPAPDGPSSRPAPTVPTPEGRSTLSPRRPDAEDEDMNEIRQPSRSNHITFLNHLVPADSPSVGEKALALGILSRAGLVVPAGFVVTAGSDDEIEAAYHDLERQTARPAVPVAVRASLLGDERQLGPPRPAETDLRGVPAVIDAVRRCHARQAAPAAVIVQRMAVGERAGIVYSMDPVRRDDGVVRVTAGFGADTTWSSRAPGRHVPGEPPHV